MKKLSFLLVLLLMGCSSNPDIIVKKKLVVPLNKYKNAYVDVQNDAYNTVLERQLGKDATSVDLRISSV